MDFEFSDEQETVPQGRAVTSPMRRSRRTPRRGTATTSSRSTPSRPWANWGLFGPSVPRGVRRIQRRFRHALHRHRRARPRRPKHGDHARGLGVGTGRGNPIYTFGTEEQRQTWFARSGRRSHSRRLRPDRARCRERRLAAPAPTPSWFDGQWVVNGEKAFITNSGTSMTSIVTVTAAGLVRARSARSSFRPERRASMCNRSTERWGWHASEHATD